MNSEDLFKADLVAAAMHWERTADNGPLYSLIPEDDSPVPEGMVRALSRPATEREVRVVGEITGRDFHKGANAAQLRSELKRWAVRAASDARKVA